MEHNSMRAWMSLGRLLRQWPSWPAHLFTFIGLWQFLGAIFPEAKLPEITFVTIPWWGWLLAALFLYMVSSAKVLAETLQKAAEELNRAAENSAKLVKLRERVDAVLGLNVHLSKFLYLTQCRTRFDALEEDYASKWSSFPRYMADGGRLGRGHFGDLKTKIDILLRQMQELAAECLDRKVDLFSHPKFTENPNREVEGEEVAANDDFKNDYRRYFDIHATSKSALRSIRANLTQQIDQLTAALREMGKHS